MNLFKINKKLQKRGQTEIMGLVIIVVLITMGMLFLAIFAVKDSPEKKIFTRKGLAYSGMSTILKSEVYCDSQANYLQVGEDLLEDCAKYYDDSFSNLDCSGMHSCEFLENYIGQVLNETLGQWNKDFQFKSELVVSNNRYTILEVDDGSCARAKERDSSGLFPLYVKDAGGLVESTLYLCD